MQETEYQEKRTFERFAIRLSLRYLEADSYKEFDAQAHDICAGGMCFIAHRMLEPLTSLNLNIPCDQRSISTQAEVIWAHPAGLNRYKIGVRFLNVDLLGISRIIKTYLLPADKVIKESKGLCVKLLLGMCRFFVP